MLHTLASLLCFITCLFPASSSEKILPRISQDTWSYFHTVTYPNGLPDDRMELNGDQVILPDRTSPTNIGLYLFAISCAKRLDIIKPEEASLRVEQTLNTLARMDRHHGFYLNWYQASTAIAMKEWKPGQPLVPFLSSVDNAWLAVALIHIEHEYPELAAKAKDILKDMNFDFFYDELVGCFYGGYDNATGNFTVYHYRILNSETRIVSYVATHLGQVPKTHWSKLNKTKKEGRLLSCYGSMFEALAVALFVPEVERSPSWKQEHENYLKYHIENSICDFWGISYSDDARGIYKEFGLKNLSIYPTHFESENVVTPYASFLALQIDKSAALKNINKLFNVCYNEYGFFGAYRPLLQEKSKNVFTLEQGCIMMAIADIQKENPSKYIFEGLVEPDFP